MDIKEKRNQLNDKYQFKINSKNLSSIDNSNLIYNQARNSNQNFA